MIQCVETVKLAQGLSILVLGKPSTGVAGKGRKVRRGVLTPRPTDLTMSLQSVVLRNPVKWRVPLIRVVGTE